MSLNKIVAEVTDANDTDGVINRHAAINAAVPQVLADKELTEMCVRGHVSKLIASNVKSRIKERAKADTGQSSFFGLRDHHVIDDGEGQIKHTSILSRMEFVGLIRLRQDQVNADLAYLTKLRAAERDTREIWDRHPDWTWGQVEAEHARRHARAA